MSREPRAPLTAGIVRKGEGAVVEPMPETTQKPAPAQTLPVQAAPAKEAMTAFTVRFPDPLIDRLRLLMYRTKRGKGDLLVEALSRFLDSAGV